MVSIIFNGTSYYRLIRFTLITADDHRCELPKLPAKKYAGMFRILVKNSFINFSFEVVCRRCQLSIKGRIVELNDITKDVQRRNCTRSANKCQKC